jgi:hypothetical protein
VSTAVGNSIFSARAKAACSSARQVADAGASGCRRRWGRAAQSQVAGWVDSASIAWLVARQVVRFAAGAAGERHAGGVFGGAVVVVMCPRRWAGPVRVFVVAGVLLAESVEFLDGCRTSPTTGTRAWPRWVVTWNRRPAVVGPPTLDPLVTCQRDDEGPWLRTLVFAGLGLATPTGDRAPSFAGHRPFPSRTAGSPGRANLLLETD